MRQSDSVHKLIDEDGNVVLVVCDVRDSQNYNCCIINEVAENSSNCQVTTQLLSWVLRNCYLRWRCHQPASRWCCRTRM